MERRFAKVSFASSFAVVVLVLASAGCDRSEAAGGAAGEGAARTAPFAVRVNKVESFEVVAPNKVYADQGLGTKAGPGKVFACVQYELTNVGGAPERSRAPSVVDGRGNAVETSVAASSHYQPADWTVGSRLAKVAPGASVRLADCFEVPSDAATGMKLRIEAPALGPSGGWRVEAAL